MPATLEQYASHGASLMSVVDVNGMPWACSGRVLKPLAMPHKVSPVSRPVVRQAIRQTGAWLALWNDAWDTASCEWWWVCCDDRNYDIERLPKNARRDIRAGLRRCEIRKLDPQWFADNRYPIETAARRGYGRGHEVESPDEVRRRTLAEAQYPGRETWGAFVDNAFAAYFNCIVVDDAVLLSSVKSDPTFHKALPNNALAYQVTRHYLVERNMAYITDGTRSLAHETQFQGFLEKMGYRRIYCPLRIEMRDSLRWLLRAGIGWWGRFLIGPLRPPMWRQVSGLVTAVAIAHSCSQGPVASKQNAPLLDNDQSHG